MCCLLHHNTLKATRIVLVFYVANSQRKKHVLNTKWALKHRTKLEPFLWLCACQCGVGLVSFFCYFFFPSLPPSVLEGVGKEGFKKKKKNNSTLLIVYVHQKIKAFLLKTNRENYSPRKE